MDRALILAAAFLRALGIGMMPVVLGKYLAGQGELGVGAISAVGLAGAALATLAVGVYANRFGRRRSFLLLSLLSVGGGTMLALSSAPAILVIGAFLAMTNAMGRDRAAAYTLEQAVIPSTVADDRRTSAFAGYNMLLGLGHAGGATLGALPKLLRASAGVDEILSLRLALLVPCAFAGISAVLYLFLSRAIETAEPSRPISPRSRGIIARISALSALDSLGGGFLVGTLIAFYFFKRFGKDEGALAALFTAGAVVQALSFPVAAWLARRIGLVNTMVFTHIPASLVLMAVPFAPTFAVAVALWLVREFLVEMDVPTRQSYIAAVVSPEERPVAASVTNLVRLGAWAVGAPLGGAAMRLLAPAAHLYIGGAIKIVYDLSLWFAFRRLKPPEEVSR